MNESQVNPSLTGRLFKIACIALIILSYLSFTYSPDLGCWVSFLGTALILLFSRLAWPDAWALRVGLRIPGRDIRSSVLLFAACSVLSFGLISIATAAADVRFLLADSTGSFFRRALFTAGQTLNEEIVLGALLLHAASCLCTRTRRVIISVGVALVFALLHQAFYAFRPQDMHHHGILTIPALTAVFAVGVLRNNLILHYRHIGFSWAIHLGWNLAFFGPAFWRTDSGLNEPQRFNVMLGHPLTVVVVVTAASSSVFLCRRTLLERRGS